jgi:hypothetical protein
MSTPNVRRRDRVPSLSSRGQNRCNRCKTARWRCTKCSRFCCEHRSTDHQTNKDNPADKTCTCGKCSLIGRHRRA